MPAQQVTPRSNKPALALMAEWSAASEASRAGGATRTKLSHEACDFLVRAGINPTVALVRQITNTGANDAIARDIEEWRVALGQLLQNKEMRLGVPDTLASEVERFAAALWQQARATSSAQFDEDRLACEAVARDAIAATEALSAAVASAEARVESLIQQNEQLSEKLLTETNSLAASNATNDALRADVLRLQRAETTTAAAHEKTILEWKARLAASEESSKKALNEAESSRKFVLMQLDGQRELERGLREQLNELKNDTSARENAERLRRNELMGEVASLSVANGKLTGQVEELRSQLSTSADKRRHEIQDAEQAAMMKVLMSDEMILNGIKQYHMKINPDRSVAHAARFRVTLGGETLAEP